MSAVFRSVTAQVADHLRAALLRGRWSGALPGRNRLSAELGVNRKTVEAALRQLEVEGILVNQGAGRRRRITLPAETSAPLRRVAILTYEPADRFLSYIVQLQHALADAGHTAFIAGKSLAELGTDVARIERLVRRTEADAWAVMAGARAVLEWFAARPAPAFALFGRREGIPIAAAGPDIGTAMVEAARRLLGLGHRRIVLICRRERRLPEPGRTERMFLDELAAHGIATSNFNLPDWEETPEGLQSLLGALFHVTPPTALIVGERALFDATRQFLAKRGLRVPEHVSLICQDPDPGFAWCLPTIAHIAWNPEPVVRLIVRWATKAGTGPREVKQTLTPAEFVPGGTLGPAPQG